VAERTRADGSVRQPLDPAAVEALERDASPGQGRAGGDEAAAAPRQSAQASHATAPRLATNLAANGSLLLSQSVKSVTSRPLSAFAQRRPGPDGPPSADGQVATATRKVAAPRQERRASDAAICDACVALLTADRVDTLGCLLWEAALTHPAQEPIANFSINW
jgi:hypothetical protein